ncbi:uncharacterized protein BDR25DRAFT_393125 [Lindgomyces ingoldianus]|uniref:Uncharacterized protein n=1 Tax=Lindgomyces ingoldianus TaxID=673940 RepID=A0ACB6QZN1_9PLEO|nr:uncharacterized protein BDR25DRAFT_393125 [Lindgomyces ingoldianus]KAF2472247.1 hypothetical protein BDR25DRAFT_393125 [Lindgomyces ingoldianus]
MALVVCQWLPESIRVSGEAPIAHRQKYLISVTWILKSRFIICDGFFYQKARPLLMTTHLRMAASSFITRQLPSERFVESCGAVLFDLTASPEKKVCLLHYLRKDEWLLAKGRRNCGESRKEAALREVVEETGYLCHLLPVTMATRAPPADGSTDIPDMARTYPNLTEPFMFTMREIEGGSSVKLIWWYIATLDSGSGATTLTGEADFAPEFFPCEEALDRLTFQPDRDVLKQAVRLVEESTALRNSTSQLDYDKNN